MRRSRYRNRGHFHPYADFDSSAINVPRFAVGWSDRNAWYFDVTWGNGNSDPVWTVGFTIIIPFRKDADGVRG